MMLMPSNHSSKAIRELAVKYPGRIGWLVGPSAHKKTKLRSQIPFALDNDAFSAWSKKREWDVAAWRAMLAWARDSGFTPLWALVPDIVTNKRATIENWITYAPEARSFGWPIAFAVQDGMETSDIPKDADVVFVGGSSNWKWRTAEMWCKNFKRVHVGRVNNERRLQYCEDIGAESVDGTGWFRDKSDPKKMPVMLKWLDGIRDNEPELNLGLL